MRKPILILFYDTMWNTPLPRVELPEGFEISTDRARLAQAQAVVFHLPQWKWQPQFLLPRKRAGQVWLAWSMECQENHPRLQDPNFMRVFDGTITYRLDSDIPALYFQRDMELPHALAELATAPQVKDARAPAVAFISSRINQSKRREYLRELMSCLEIDSYGKYLNNVPRKKDNRRSFKLETIAHYKFTLAFENAISPDYVTEKFYDPLSMGSVPVYLGAPNIETFAPGDHCFVNVNDYAGPQALAAYLQSLLRDTAAYEAYFEWKQKPLRPAFLELAELCRRPMILRLCDWLEQNKL